VLEGKIIGRCMQRHRHQEFIRFLNTIEAEIPAGKIIHVVLDNYATQKHSKVRAWLARHPRFVFHFIPTSSSWLNAVEGFFAKLTRRRLKRGVFRSIVDLPSIVRNALFAGHDAGAENWACLALLIETCKLNGVDPQAYLTDVLTRLVTCGRQRGSMS
jgi:transposase